MAAYLVTWTIELEADSHEDAAKKALAIQRDRKSQATFFKVTAEDEDEDDAEEIDGRA